MAKKEEILVYFKHLSLFSHEKIPEMQDVKILQKMIESNYKNPQFLLLLCDKKMSQKAV